MSHKEQGGLTFAAGPCKCFSEFVRFNISWFSWQDFGLVQSLNPRGSVDMETYVRVYCLGGILRFLSLNSENTGTIHPMRLVCIIYSDG